MMWRPAATARMTWASACGEAVIAEAGTPAMPLHEHRPEPGRAETQGSRSHTRCKGEARHRAGDVIGLVTGVRSGGGVCAEGMRLRAMGLICPKASCSSSTGVPARRGSLGRERLFGDAQEAGGDTCVDVGDLRDSGHGLLDDLDR